MIRYTLLTLVFSLTCIVAGCGAQSGTSMVKYDKSTPTRLSEAPAGGMYALYSEFGINPDVTYSLKRGDPVGFTTEDGKVYAVAGDHRDAIKPGTVYYWKLIDQ